MAENWIEQLETGERVIVRSHGRFRDRAGHVVRRTRLWVEVEIAGSATQSGWQSRFRLVTGQEIAAEAPRRLVPWTPEDQVIIDRALLERRAFRAAGQIEQAVNEAISRLPEAVLREVIALGKRLEILREEPEVKA